MWVFSKLSLVSLRSHRTCDLETFSGLFDRMQWIRWVRVNNGRFFESQLIAMKVKHSQRFVYGLPAQNEWPTGFPKFLFVPLATVMILAVVILTLLFPSIFNQQTFRFDFKRLLLRVSLGTVRLAATTSFASMPGSWFLFFSAVKFKSKIWGPAASHLVLFKKKWPSLGASSDCYSATEWLLATFLDSKDGQMKPSRSEASRKPRKTEIMWSVWWQWEWRWMHQQYTMKQCG